MNTKEVELVVVDYKTDEIENTSVTLIKNFAIYSGILGAREWARHLVSLSDIIQNQKPTPYLLSAEGIEIRFSGFPNPAPILRDGKVIFEPREPRFVITDSDDLLLPSESCHIGKITDEIGKEMEDVYKLRRETNPQSLIFPKTEYSRSITVFEGVLIQDYSSLA